MASLVEFALHKDEGLGTTREPSSLHLVRRHWLSVGCRFCQHVGHLAEMPRNVIELEAIELVLQLADFSVVCSHLGIVAALLLHDLIDD